MRGNRCARDAVFRCFLIDILLSLVWTGCWTTSRVTGDLKTIDVVMTSQYPVIYIPNPNMADWQWQWKYVYYHINLKISKTQNARYRYTENSIEYYSFFDSIHGKGAWNRSLWAPISVKQKKNFILRVIHAFSHHFYSTWLRFDAAREMNFLTLSS